MVVYFTLISCILAKKYIVSYKNTIDPLTYNNGQRTLQDYDQKITIGDISFDIIDRDDEPIYLYNNPNVLSIEEEMEFSIDGFEMQKDPLWNLDRIDQRYNALNKRYYYNSLAGEGVNIYVLDTGIFINHPEFEGRALWGLNTADSEDEHGCMHSHGTHVAGSIASKAYGVSKKANVISVKVLNCQGRGSTSNVLRGIEWTVNQNKKKKIINMSLGGGYSSALNAAVDQATANGVLVIAAAGNSNQDACSSSPASAKSSITVGATDQSTRIAYFSNWGTCVNIFAPGVDIVSTSLDGKSSSKSGTSMAAPHISGVIALMIDASTEEVSQEFIKDFISKTSTKGSILGDLKNSPNNFIFSLPAFAI